jgi:hypothetical protein
VKCRHLIGCVAAVAMACGASATSPSSAAQPLEYRDPAGRFAFAYPRSFGTTSVGTDNGFGNRVASVRFSVFSSQGIGGEAVVGQAAPSLDLLTAGGLYDDIASGTLPLAIQDAVRAQLPLLTLANFCSQIARERHLDADASVFASLTPTQRTALADLDRMGNVAPEIRRCTISGDAVAFDKEAAFVEGAARRRTYGAVRFLDGRYSTFQLIRAGGAPVATTLDEMLGVVQSFRVY